MVRLSGGRRELCTDHGISASARPSLLELVLFDPQVARELSSRIGAPLSSRSSMS